MPPSVGSATAFWFTTVNAEADKVGAGPTKILRQRIRGGRFRKAREIAEYTTLFGPPKVPRSLVPFGPQRTTCCVSVTRQGGITRYEPFQAQGLGVGERAAEGCPEVDRLIANGWGCGLLAQGYA